MAKTATKADQSTATASKASIPGPRPGMSPADILKSFAKKATVKAPSAKQRAVLELTPEAESLFRDWVPAKILSDAFSDHLKLAVAALDEKIFPLYIHAMWQNKSKPQNPDLKANKDGRLDIQGQFQVQEKFSINAPDCSDGSDPKEAFVVTLVGIGMQEDDARRLVEDELFFEPSMNIPLSALFYGKKVDKNWVMPTSVESSAAAKLLAYMNGQSAEPLTDEEQAALVTVTSTKVSMKNAGFLDRAAGYCKSEEVLRKLLQFVIKPVLVHRGAKFGVSDPSDEKNRRLGEVAVQILVDALGSIGASDSDDE